MSLNRLCLRLAAIVALSNNGQSPWPTAAEDRVFDGRIEPIESMVSQDAPFPVILVETPVHENGLAGQKMDGKHFVDLVFDIGLGLRAEGEDSAFTIALPQTDSELDTALDLIENQVHRALARSEVFQSVCLGLVSVSSVLAPPEDNQRAAIRYVRYQVQVLRDSGVSRAVPQNLQPLLAALDANSAFAERAGMIRAAFAEDADATQSVLAMLDRKWSRETAEILGYSGLSAPVAWPSDIRAVIDHPAGVAEAPESGLAP